ncbi:MAG TPA: sulfatase/phosphatase domain-containing protein, partial [Opitutaceae bacterium]|nr:sulfatase/phosphatase domain-containing protein [Opitutaceae bacterium]
HLGEHGGFYAKMSIMDESARAPLIVAGAGIKAPGVAQGLVEYVDLFPTLVELTGVPKPAGLQGTSFASQLRNPAGPGREGVYTIVLRGTGTGRAWHTPAYTYLEWPDGSTQLYDVARDPHEYVNLAADPAQAVTLASMKLAMAKRREEIGVATAEAQRGR